MKQFNKFLQEALSPEHAEQVRQWVDGAGGKALAAKIISQHVFKDKDVLIHPLNEENKEIPIHDGVKAHLEQFGYKIPSGAEYHAGYAVDKHQRITSIGKALRKTKADPSIVGAFENDPNRNAANKKKLAIAYTWEPHHVASMSTGRGWSSCMNMDGGMNKHYLEHDIAHGTHVAYLIHDDDHKIESPLARIAIKPFVSEDKEHTILRPENTLYGTAKNSFGEHVAKWAETHFPAKTDVIYHKPDNLYNDSYDKFVRHSPKSIIESVDALADPTQAQGYGSPHKKKMRNIIHGDDLHVAIAHAITKPHIVSAPLIDTIMTNAGEARVQPKTVNMMAEHVMAGGYFREGVHIVETHAEKLDTPTVNKFAEFVSKIHNNDYGSRGLMSHSGLTSENMHKVIDSNPDSLMYVPPHRVDKQIVAKVHEAVASDRGLSYTHLDNVLGSKAFGVDDMHSAIKAAITPDNSDRGANIRMTSSRLISNPNYTIDVARDMDKTYGKSTEHAFALAHPHATVQDVEDAHAAGKLDGMNVRKIKSADAMDATFAKSPNLVYRNARSFDYPSDKTRHFVVAASDDHVPNTEMVKKILTEVTPNNIPLTPANEPDSELTGLVKRNVHSSLTNLVHYHGDKPELHPHIHTAIENAANSGDVLLAHSMIYATKTHKMPVKRSTIDLVNRKSAEHDYSQVHETGLTIHG